MFNKYCIPVLVMLASGIIGICTGISAIGLEIIGLHDAAMLCVLVALCFLLLSYCMSRQMEKERT